MKQTKKEFSVGDKVWWAKYQRENVKETCPICDGKLRVTVILGNGNHIETDCTYCEKGFQPCGWITEYEYVSDVKQVEITHKEVNEGANGRSVEYMYGCYCLTLDNAFETREEAEEKLKEKIAKAKKEDLERTEYSKNQNPRKYSWDVGYYRRQKRDALKTIERCDRKIKYFKAKIKDSR
jgi:hypothetical protein